MNLTELKLKSHEFMKELRKGNDLPDGPYLRITYRDNSKKIFTRREWALFGVGVIDNLKRIKAEMI